MPPLIAAAIVVATPVDYAILADAYSSLEGYNADADLGLGCRLPTEFARMKPDDTAVDLDSGAGNDCFVAREQTGETGRVIGLDMTEKIVGKARENEKKPAIKRRFFGSAALKTCHSKISWPTSW